MATMMMGTRKTETMTSWIKGKKIRDTGRRWKENRWVTTLTVHENQYWKTCQVKSGDLTVVDSVDHMNEINENHYQLLDSYLWNEFDQILKTKTNQFKSTVK